MRLLSRSGAVFRSVSFSIRHGVKSTLPLLGDLVHVFFRVACCWPFCSCVSVRLSVREHISGSIRPNFCACYLWSWLIGLPLGRRRQWIHRPIGIASKGICANHYWTNDDRIGNFYRPTHTLSPIRGKFGTQQCTLYVVLSCAMEAYVDSLAASNDTLHCIAQINAPSASYWLRHVDDGMRRN